MLQVKKFIHIFPLFSLIFLMVFISACSSSQAEQQSPQTNNEATLEDVLPAEASNAGYSCDATEMLGFCYNYTGSGWTQEKIELDCGFIEENMLQTELCSSESVVATCNFDLQGNSDLAIVYYFYEPTDLTTAERMCPGTFFPAE